MAYDATYPDNVDGMVLITPGMKPQVDLSLSGKFAVFTDSVFAPARQLPTPIDAENVAPLLQMKFDGALPSRPEAPALGADILCTLPAKHRVARWDGEDRVS